jgi:hypothetical protein
VIAPDGTILEGKGRHLQPAYAVLSQSGGVWHTYSSHTTIAAVAWRISRNEIPNLTLTIAEIAA